MNRWRLLLLLLVACLNSAEPSRPLSEVLARLATAEPSAIVQQVDAWSGAPHPLLLLARGQARWRIAQEQAEGRRRDGIAAAAADFAAALALDPRLRPAHLGLAQCAAARDDWATASTSAAAAIDPAAADVGLLAFLANAGLRAGDWRLAEVTAHYGIMRFPRDRSLRRIELSVLIQSGRTAAAREAVLALLAQEPAEAQLWRHLAWAAQALERQDEAAAALEVALALQPEDAGLRRQLAQLQCACGVAHAALRTVRPLLDQPSAPDAGVVLLAARIAGEAGDPRLGLSWLATLPDAQRDREQRILTARLAIQAADTQTAAAALDAIIAFGERDPAVLAWAGSLAESRGDAARAEALYLQASAGGSAAGGAVVLRLVALYLRQDRRAEAQSTLAAYRLAAPEDAQARALQAQLERVR